MPLPFTTTEFFGVFAAYNDAVWPLQWLLLAAAGVALVAAVRSGRESGVLVSALLAGLWAWMALAYHARFFAAINPLAYGFAALSLAASALFIWQGVVRRRLHFRWQPGPRGWAAAVTLLFALVGYPAWALAAGHRYPAFATFGLPCPTTLFTIGLLALAVRPCPRSVFVVPVLWCLIGSQAAFLLGVPQDLGLLPAAALGMALALRSGAAARRSQTG